MLAHHAAGVPSRRAHSEGPALNRRAYNSDNDGANVAASARDLDRVDGGKTSGSLRAAASTGAAKSSLSVMTASNGEGGANAQRHHRRSRKVLRGKDSFFIVKQCENTRLRCTYVLLYF